MLGWFSGKSPGYFGDTTAVSVGQVVHPITQPGLQLVHLGWVGNHGVDLTFRDALQKKWKLTFSSTLSASFTTSPLLFPNTWEILKSPGPKIE